MPAAPDLDDIADHAQASRPGYMRLHAPEIRVMLGG
jgi:hypothetical protein